MSWYNGEAWIRSSNDCSLGRDLRIRMRSSVGKLSNAMMNSVQENDVSDNAIPHARPLEGFRDTYRTEFSSSGPGSSRTISNKENKRNSKIATGTSSREIRHLVKPLAVCQSITRLTRCVIFDRPAAPRTGVMV